MLYLFIYRLTQQLSGHIRRQQKCKNTARTRPGQKREWIIKVDLTVEIMLEEGENNVIAMIKS